MHARSVIHIEVYNSFRVLQVNVANTDPCLTAITQVVDMLMSHFPDIQRRINEDLARSSPMKIKKWEKTHKRRCATLAYSFAAKFRYALEMQNLNISGKAIPCDSVTLVRHDLVGQAAVEVARYFSMSPDRRFKMPYPFAA